jgi:dihydroorotate dehydrogenase
MQWLWRIMFDYRHPELERRLFGLSFRNPVGLAAGFDKDAEFIDEFDAFGFGFIEIGTITPLAQPGNPKPRLFRLPSDEALINRMGFNNEGVESAVLKLKNRNRNILVGGNIGKNKLTPNEEAIRDYEICFESLFEYVDYFVVNVSSPNTPDLRELQEKESLKALLHRLLIRNRKKKMPRPILLKIAPDLSERQLDDIVEIVEELQIDGIIATNTTISRENLKQPHEDIEKLGSGGLSGRPLRTKSTEIIRYIRQRSQSHIPIIGVGGIDGPEEAIEKLKAGADLLQIYTGFIYKGPSVIKKINKAIIKFQRKH